MKKSFYAYVAVLLIIFSFATVEGYKERHKKSAPITAQQKAVHRITILDDDEEGKAQCTATAIGPNVLMTAEHCVKEGKEFATAINIDRSTKMFHIVGIGLDDRDHALVFIKEMIFTNIVEPLPSKLNVGDPVYIFGNGGGEYPARKLTGVVIDCADPSDVDAADDIACFSLPVIPGDSGSIVFDKNGNAAAIVTYKHKLKEGTDTAIGFGLSLESFHLQPIVPVEKKKHEFNPFQGLF